MSRLQVKDVALRATPAGLFAQPGALIHVTVTGTGSDATIYADETGSGTIANPMVADQFGRYEGWVDLGVDYDVTQTPSAGQGLPDMRRLLGSVVNLGAVTLAALPDLLVVGAITRDANGAATLAAVAWPDGATGTYTATLVSTAFPGAVDAYTITHTLGGVTKTYTQAAVTRDANGNVTNRPQITVS